MSREFLVKVEMADEADGQRVRHKPDGERFTGPAAQNTTLKFNVEHTYTLTLTFRPQKLLQYWVIRGEKMTFNRVKPKKDEDEVSVYETHWPSTGMGVTKRGERTYLPMELELDSGQNLKLTLQGKFYPRGETAHCRWGQELHALELKCLATDGNVYVDVTNEKIF